MYKTTKIQMSILSGLAVLIFMLWLGFNLMFAGACAVAIAIGGQEAYWYLRGYRYR